MRESTAGRRFPIGENAAYVISRRRISLITICRSRPSEKSAYRGEIGTQLTPDVVDAFLRLVEKGEFRAADDLGGGSMENIENIRNE